VERSDGSGVAAKPGSVEKVGGFAEGPWRCGWREHGNIGKITMAKPQRQKKVAEENFLNWVDD
jgi:hypothetical protein